MDSFADENDEDVVYEDDEIMREIEKAMDERVKEVKGDMKRRKKELFRLRSSFVSDTKVAANMLSGRHNVEVDPEGAVAILEERVKENDADAMWLLGLCCEYGRGIKQDIERAEMLYSQCNNRERYSFGLFFMRNNSGGRGTGVMIVNHGLR